MTRQKSPLPVHEGPAALAPPRQSPVGAPIHNFHRAGSASPRSHREGIVLSDVTDLTDGERGQNPASDGAQFMQQAIAQARQGLGKTRPNPAVGAVIVDRGQIIGQGFHRGAGQPHAEIEALNDATRRGFGPRINGASIFVTLEPCNHQGRTGPCTQRIVSEGIAKVVVGSLDPNPIVSGRGARFLRRHGVEVEVGVERDQCTALIRGYHKHVRTGMPWVIAKAAVSLDGRLATRSGDSKGLSGPVALRHLHQLRASCDAIVVGLGTVLTDNPRLNVRGIKGAAASTRLLLRVVVDSHAKTPVNSRVLQQPGQCLIAHLKDAPQARLNKLRAAGAELISCRSKAGQVSLADLFRQLGKRGLMRVLVEGGGRLHGSLLRAKLADSLSLYLTPHIIGGDGVPLFAGAGLARVDTLALKNPQWLPVGEDLLFSAEF